jgi:hypothetical protein
MVATRGRIVQTPTSEKPYKVVLEHDGRMDSEHPVWTMREGEALIRLETPDPLARETARDGPSRNAFATWPSFGRDERPSLDRDSETPGRGPVHDRVPGAPRDR